MMMAIIAMIVVILVGIVLNSIHLTFHLTSLCWFTGECLWVPKRRIKWIYVFCPTGRSVECFPNSRWKESHLSSNCRRPMIKNKLSAGVIIKKRDVDMIHVCKSTHLDKIFWLIWPQFFFFHPDLPLAMSLLMIPREFKQLLHCQFLWLKARIGNWDLKANFIPLVWSKLSNTSRRHAQCTL